LNKNSKYCAISPIRCKPDFLELLDDAVNTGLAESHSDAIRRFTEIGYNEAKSNSGKSLLWLATADKIDRLKDELSITDPLFKQKLDEFRDKVKIESTMFLSAEQFSRWEIAHFFTVLKLLVEQKNIETNPSSENYPVKKEDSDWIISDEYFRRRNSVKLPEIREKVSYILNKYEQKDVFGNDPVKKFCMYVYCMYVYTNQFYL